MELISVIVPVYNVRAYLESCINSIINQTYKNLDIILVDDGSTDGSGEVCDKFLEIDKRIRVFHKNNGGLSDARNYGLKEAQGELIGFVDSDDMLDKRMYEVLYYNMKKFDADISICSYKLVWSQELEPNIANEDTEGEVFSSEEALNALLSIKKFQSHACDKLYKKNLFNDIKYPKGLIYEDIATTYKLIDRSNKIVYCKYKGYFYLQRKESIFHSKFSIKHMDMIKAYNDMIKYFRIYYPNIVNRAISMYVNANIILLKEMYISKYKDKNIEKELIRNIKKNLHLYIKSNNIKLKYKIFGINSVYFRINFKIICCLLRNLRKVMYCK